MKNRTYQSELLIIKLINQNFLSQSLSIIASYHRTYQSELLITKLINQNFLSQNLPIRTSYHKAYQSELLWLYLYYSCNYSQNLPFRTSMIISVLFMLLYTELTIQNFYDYICIIHVTIHRTYHSELLWLYLYYSCYYTQNLPFRTSVIIISFNGGHWFLKTDIIKPSKWCPCYVFHCVIWN